MVVDDRDDLCCCSSDWNVKFEAETEENFEFEFGEKVGIDCYHKANDRTTHVITFTDQCSLRTQTKR